MGALTSKTLPFELREWDIEYFESIDPTDSFGSNTRVYIKENEIVQIEPDYNVFTYDIWMTDKGRQFFDSIFNVNKKKLIRVKDYQVYWPNAFDKIIKVIYYFDFFNCIRRTHKIKKVTIIFENLGLEVLSFLTILQNNFSFLKIKKIENNKIFNNLESNFQLNMAANKIKLNSSTFCLIVSNNPRYEGYYLNLYLKKRFSKGNFECFILGSFTNLTFFTSFLGSSSKTFIDIIKGKHLICQKLKSKKKPCLILNTNFFKRSDSTIYLKSLQILQQSNIFSTNWNGVNVLNYNLCENGINATSKFPTLQLKDLLHFSVLYFLNIGVNNLSVLKRLTKSKLLNYSKNNLLVNSKESSKFLIIDQAPLHSNKLKYLNRLNCLNKKKDNYSIIPTTMFYENEDTFINTKGGVCGTTKLISRGKMPWWGIEKFQNNWQILRRVANLISKNLFFCSNVKNNYTLSPHFNSLHHFKNFIAFNFYATVKLTNLSFYLYKQTNVFSCLNYKFKQKPIKIYNTKFNYWLDNFFIGGKDEYSFNSKTLKSCSKIVKRETTLFF